MSKQYLYRYRGTYNGVKIDIKADTEAEIERKKSERKKQIDEGVRICEPTVTVRQWGNRWLSSYVEPTVSSRTYADYKNRINKHIYPTIGNMRMRDVRDIHCNQIINKMQGYSRDQIKKVSRDMFRMFKKGMKNGVCLINPADDLAIPKTAKDHKRRALTAEERKVILKVAEKHPAGLWIRTMLYLGMRPGETDRMLGKHINYKKGIVFIDGTKTDAAKRYVPAPDELLNEFQELDRKPEEHIFKNSFGDKTTAKSRTLLWNDFKYQINIQQGCEVFKGKLKGPLWTADDLVPYLFRHTFATDLKDALIPDAIRKELLGHADKDVTDGYTHRTEDSLKIAKQMLEKYRKKKK